MNSIAYLDALLTRSLTSSPANSRAQSRRGSVSRGSGSGGRRSASSSAAVTAFSAAADADADERDRLEVAQEVLGTGAAAAGTRVVRRASDYSLRRGERERRQAALGLGLTPAHPPPTADRPAAAAQSSAAAEAAHDAAAAPEPPRAGPSNAAVRSRVEGRSRGPRVSASDGGPAVSLSPLDLPHGGMGRRATSARPATPARWASLWGLPLHGWFEPGVGSMPVTPSPLARRASSGSLRLGKWRDELEEAADLRADALLGVGMSQAEEEDVVDFEGGEPESDDDNPAAPPATPAAGLLQHSRGASVTHRSEGSESTRLASFLFGALASRVDDYFGPQPSSRMSPPSSPTGSRRRSRAPSSVDPLVPVGPAVSSSSGSSSAEEQSGPSAASQAKPSAPDTSGVAPDEPALVDAAALTEAGAPDDPKLLPLPVDATETVTVDPPPPYTPSPPESPALASQPLSTVRRALAAVHRALDALRRALIALFLLPLHLLHLKQEHVRHDEPVPAFAPAPSTPPATAEPRLRFAPDNKPRRSESASEAGVSSDTGVEARRPLTPGVKGRVVNLVDEAAASGSGDASAEESSENEPHTEDEAAARLKRRAERQARKEAAAKAAGTAADEQNEKRVVPPKPSPSRLLPNPHPVNPYLAKDPKARKVDDRLPDVEKAVVRRGGTLAPLGTGGIPRAPASHVIHHTPKVLVLDLDETLIHSTSRSPTWSALRAGAGRRPTVSTGGSLLGLDGLGAVLGLGERGVRPHQVEVLLDGRSVIYHVYKRPYVDYFLRKVASWYHVVIFTASVQEYADPVIDWLDQGRGLIGGRMFREACTYRNGSYLKDLALVDQDLSRVCLVDNSPMSYLINPANGIPIEGWTHDPNDECLLDLLPVLDALRFASDVRNVLSIRGF